MEKKITALFLIICGFLLAGCIGPYAGGAYIKKPMTTKFRIAVASDNFLADALQGELIKRGYAITTKGDLDRALSGKGTVGAGSSEHDSMIRGGKMLQADAVMTIKMIPFSWDEHTVHTAFVKIFDTERGDLIGSVTYQNSPIGLSRDSLPGSADRIARKLFEGAD
jgi:hypothetical protein